MEVVPVSEAMIADIRAKTAPQLDAFRQARPAADKPIKAYLAEMKREALPWSAFCPHLRIVSTQARPRRCAPARWHRPA